MMSSPWFEEVSASTSLMQGDLIFSCPVVTWKAAIPTLESINEQEILKAAIDIIQADVVVMTQACDLEQNHVRHVTLCPHISISDFKSAWEESQQAKMQSISKRSWESTCNDIKDGYVWNLALLNSGEAGSLSIDHRIVDFHDVFTLPRIFLESVIQRRGKSRLRLLPPYREHLSQAFARFYMRVGLPTPLRKVW